ncbi:hypothetical protein PV327_009274 [Microctonus hyperodae]|uniref:Uncharacterized protein n=1 Tax=Microctonus hyperodae TaxID=165561 RepID=A0AA39FTG2_MICHY|nr:hypothetical protein PV327_009274 [Microctonus hyperodae]
MPRKAFVTIEEALAVVQKYMPHFTTNELPPYSSKIWREMSKELNDKWSPHLVYIHVRQNRRQLLSTARKNMGIDLPVIPPTTKCKGVTNDIDEDYIDDVELDNVDLDSYELIITKDQWHKLLESVEYINSEYVLLKKSIWSDVLSLACYKHVNEALSEAKSSKQSEYQPK